MKMLNKIALFIYSVLVIVASFIIMVLPLDIKGIIGINETVAIIRNMRGNYIYSLLGLIMLLVSMVILFYLFRSDGKSGEGSYLVLRNEFGEIFIYQETVAGLVQNVAQKFSGIRNIRTKVVFVEGKISLSLKGEAGNEINIPEISMELQKKVKEHVENITGANVNDIRVEIVNVAQAISRS